MSRIRLTWANASTTIVEQRVYRSTSPLDIDDMPDPLAVLPRRNREYLDSTIGDGLAYYYAVSSVLPDYSELISEEIKVEATPGESDLHWDKVVALLYFDGNILDYSNTSYYESPSLPQYVEGVFPYTDAIYFHPSYPNLVIQQNNTTDLDLDGDFTVELFVKIVDIGSTNMVLVERYNVGNSESGWQLYVTDRVSFYTWVGDRGGSYVVQPSGPQLNNGIWHHIAAVRQNSTISLYVDGLKVGTGTESANFISTIGQLTVGGDSRGTYRTRGNISNLRITKGVARYTENFTPPDEPFPNN